MLWTVTFFALFVEFTRGSHQKTVTFCSLDDIGEEGDNKNEKTEEKSK